MISPAPLIVWKLARLAGKLPDKMGVKGLIRQKAGWTPEVFRRCPKGEAHNAPSQSIPLRGGLEVPLVMLQDGLAHIAGGVGRVNPRGPA
jgi:hypothetical protein